MKSCATDNCDRKVEYADQRWCSDCTAIVLRTGRPPVLPVKFQPPWLKNLQARDKTGWVKAA